MSIGGLFEEMDCGRMIIVDIAASKSIAMGDSRDETL